MLPLCCLVVIVSFSLNQAHATWLASFWFALKPTQTGTKKLPKKSQEISKLVWVHQAVSGPCQALNTKAGSSWFLVLSDGDIYEI